MDHETIEDIILKYSHRGMDALRPYLPQYFCGDAAKEILGGKGAVRVHGGGFAGTIQAFVPKDALDAFVSGMESAFGRGSVSTLFVRPFGAIMFK